MKIMVFDVPAISGGALSVLNDFYNEYSHDQNNEYIFVVSRPELKDLKNIKVLNFPWIKKSWFHRLYFDYFIAPKLIKKNDVDKVLSLQNTIIPRTKKYQTVYIHNSLPFSEYKFSFFENRLLWIYQNIIGKSIVSAAKKADQVIVQTEWMERVFVNKIAIDKSKIVVSPPKINLEIKNKYQNYHDNTFFYPASEVSFKNHKTLIEACNILVKAGINNFKILLTLKGNENKNITSLKKEIEDNKLPVTFVGSLTRKEVFNKYTHTILVFPSFIESSPLPLTEAKNHGTPIIASDFEFSREILDGYKKATFFDPFNPKQLADHMNSYIKK